MMPAVAKQRIEKILVHKVVRVNKRNGQIKLQAEEKKISENEKSKTNNCNHIDLEEVSAEFTWHIPCHKLKTLMLIL